MNTQRDNLKAGLFVALGLLLTLVVVFTLSDLGSLIEPTQAVRVRYALSDGVKGLKEGAAVTLGDEPVGQVTLIEDVLEPDDAGDERVVGKIVHMQIPSHYRIYNDAIIEIKSPAIGDNSKLNIRSVGANQLYTDDRPIPGDIARSQLTHDLVRDMGIGDLQRQQLQEIIANVRDLTVALRDDLPALTHSAREKLTQLDPLLANLQAASTDARTAIENVRAVTSQVRDRTTDWVTKIDSVTTSAQSTLATVQQVVQDKEPAIRQSIDNVRDVTQTAKDQTMAQVAALLEKADASMDNVNRSTVELRNLLAGQRPVIERMLANLQLSAAQLKLAMIEVRRSPWRLIYQPKDKELETDNLYDAARSFALAAQSLESTALSLQALSHEGSQTPEQTQQMLRYLEELFGRFQEAETRFWEALGAKPTLTPIEKESTTTSPAPAGPTVGG